MFLDSRKQFVYLKADYDTIRADRMRVMEDNAMLKFENETLKNKSNWPTIAISSGVTAVVVSIFYILISK